MSLRRRRVRPRSPLADELFSSFTASFHQNEHRNCTSYICISHFYIFREHCMHRAILHVIRQSPHRTVTSSGFGTENILGRNDHLLKYNTFLSRVSMLCIQLSMMLFSSVCPSVCHSDIVSKRTHIPSNSFHFRVGALA